MSISNGHSSPSQLRAAHFDSTPPVRFLIVGKQRSGTTLVHQILAGHPNIASNPREASSRLLTDLGASLFNTNRDLFLGNAKDSIGPSETISRLFDLAVEQGQRIDGHVAAGLKIATGWVHEAQALSDGILTHAPNLRIVHVRREDPVSACVSYEFAAANNRFQIYAGENAPTPRIKINRTQLIHYVADWWAINAAFDRLSALTHYMRVDYERDVLTGTLLDGRDLFEFVGAPIVAPTWVNLKKPLPPKEQTVTNLAECEDVAAGTLDALAADVPLSEIMRRYGPDLPTIAADLIGQAAGHPATILRRSYWRPLSWRLFGK
ncbi:sulfotransferase [Acuticoccus yangtzensis]|uniref:sulfotransferase n=1 Tax=Acuticoccus yangtzensis TaxID=1443441 RepID=UPI00094957DC|nr:sulfotransferase [Acuticoccus yangtzensis]